MEELKSNYDFIEVTEGSKTYIVYDVRDVKAAKSRIRRFKRDLEQAKDKKEIDYLINDWDNSVVIKEKK